MKSDESISILIENAKINVVKPRLQSYSIKRSLLSRNAVEYDNILNINFLCIKKGDKYCVIGRNGNGKTTLLKAIAGIYALSQGNIYTKTDPTVVFAAGIGLEEELSVLKNIQYNLMLQGVNRPDLNLFVKEILDFCQLENSIDKQYKNLSTGYKSRLAFAIATIIKPKILLLDEVLGGGDQFFMKKARDRLFSVINASEAALIATHGPEDLMTVCNKGLVVKNGCIVFDGALTEAIEFYNNDNSD